MFCSHEATLTRKKRENLGPVIRENSVYLLFSKNFRVYGICIKNAYLEVYLTRVHIIAYSWPNKLQQLEQYFFVFV